MEKRISMYFTPVDGCDNVLCQFHKSCGFRNRKVRHMDVTLLNNILKDCFSHMKYIERIYFAVRGNSQIYKYARNIDLGDYASRCVMSYTSPFQEDTFPANMCKIYRIGSMEDLIQLMAVPDFWRREITKLYTVVTKTNIDNLASIIDAVNKLRRERTFTYTVNSIRRTPDIYIDETTILPLLGNYQYRKLEDDHLTSCRRDGMFIAIDYLGKAQLDDEDDTAFGWTGFEIVLRKILELHNASKICESCLSSKSMEWRYVIV